MGPAKRIVYGPGCLAAWLGSGNGKGKERVRTRISVDFTHWAGSYYREIYGLI